MRGMIILVVLLTTLAASASAFTVTKWKTKELSVAGNVTFTSSISATDGETITISITNTTATISNVVLKKATPKPKNSAAYIDNIAVAGDGKSVSLEVNNAGKKTLHLWLYLNTGEHVGVNVHF
jgi:hypothetical protein